MTRGAAGMIEACTPDRGSAGSESRSLCRMLARCALSCKDWSAGLGARSLSPKAIQIKVRNSQRTRKRRKEAKRKVVRRCRGVCAMGSIPCDDIANLDPTLLAASQRRPSSPHPHHPLLPLLCGRKEYRTTPGPHYLSLSLELYSKS